MLREEMAAAGPAPLAIALRRLVVGSDLLRALCDTDRFGLSERECVDRRCRPVPARLAMAIAHGGGLAGDCQLYGTAEAAAVVRPCLGRRCGLAVE